MLGESTLKQQLCIGCRTNEISDREVPRGKDEIFEK